MWIFCENRRPFELAQGYVNWPVLLLRATVEVLGACACKRITLEIKHLNKNQTFYYQKGLHRIST